MVNQIGKASAIVSTLKSFGKFREVPVELVARQIGRTEDEIRDDLEYLKNEGVVQLSATGANNMVKLVLD